MKTTPKKPHVSRGRSGPLLPIRLPRRGLLAVYFFALMVQSLLERELRQALAVQGLKSLPLYPEGRPCTRPTTRQLLDSFEPLARQTLYQANSDEFELFTTELASLLHRRTRLPRVSIPAEKFQNIPPPMCGKNAYEVKRTV